MAAATSNILNLTGMLDQDTCAQSTCRCVGQVPRSAVWSTLAWSEGEIVPRRRVLKGLLPFFRKVGREFILAQAAPASCDRRY